MIKKWKKELCVLAAVALTTIAGSAYGTICYTAGNYGHTYYCSIRCKCNNGVIQFASSDCTAIHQCCRWSLILGPGSNCSVSTFCAPCLPV